MNNIKFISQLQFSNAVPNKVLNPGVENPLPTFVPVSNNGYNHLNGVSNESLVRPANKETRLQSLLSNDSRSKTDEPNLLNSETITLCNTSKTNCLSLYSVKNKEAHTKLLIKDSKSNVQTDRQVLNQRYHNIQQFPKYRKRKRILFAKKIKHCNLELDGEVTISYLRQFLQPFIYRDIDSVIDKYIETYFIKAFNNIRENISLTSENWSQILKCSISKSVYKKFCDNAHIDPFDPVTCQQTDFPCFPSTKTQNPIHYQNPPIESNHQLKSDVTSSFSEHVLDSISECSNLSNMSESNEIIENDSDHSVASTSTCDQLYNLTVRSSRPDSQKPNTDYLKVPFNRSESMEFTISDEPKRLKMNYSIPHQELHNSIPDSRLILNHRHNFPYQNIVIRNAVTAPLKKNDFSFLTNHSKQNGNLIRRDKNYLCLSEMSEKNNKLSNHHHPQQYLNVANVSKI